MDTFQKLLHENPSILRAIDQSNRWDLLHKVCYENDCLDHIKILISEYPGACEMKVRYVRLPLHVAMHSWGWKDAGVWIELLRVLRPKQTKAGFWQLPDKPIKASLKKFIATAMVVIPPGGGQYHGKREWLGDIAETLAEIPVFHPA